MRVQLDRLPQPQRLHPPQPQLYLRGAVLTQLRPRQVDQPRPQAAEDQGKGLVAAGGPRPGQRVRQQYHRRAAGSRRIVLHLALVDDPGGWDSPRSTTSRGGLLRRTGGAASGSPTSCSPRPLPAAGCSRSCRATIRRVRRQRPPRGPGPVAASSPPAAPSGDGAEMGRCQRTPRRQSPRRRPPAGRALGPRGPVSIFAGTGSPATRIDPIEDFVANNPRGHCEYFAAALALMLRSQGIPARVVLGYRCDEWNGPGKCYQVRQSDAHAWVEAYLAAGDIPPEMRWGNDDERLGGRGMAPARRHAAVGRNRRPLRPGQGPAGLQLDRFPLGRLRHGNGSAAPGGGRLSPAGCHNPSDGPQSVQCRRGGATNCTD